MKNQNQHTQSKTRELSFMEKFTPKLMKANRTYRTQIQKEAGRHHRETKRLRKKGTIAEDLMSFAIHVVLLLGYVLYVSFALLVSLTTRASVTTHV